MPLVAHSTCQSRLQVELKGFVMDVDNIFIGLIMFASTIIAWEYFSAAETKNQVIEKSNNLQEK